MAHKLKNLSIKKVDFVDEGANPDAHIRMMKRKDAEGQTVEDNGKSSGFLARLCRFIGKAAGMNQNEIDSAIDEIEKGGSVSFSEKFNEEKNRKLADEIWNTCYALQSSLCSILNDEELDSTNTETAMKESLEEFHEVMQEAIAAWSSGKTASIVMKNEEVSDSDLEIMKSAVERLNEVIEKANKKSDEEKEDETDNKEDPKGDEEEMKIDKSKLTPAERAFLDDIEKRCGVEESAEQMESNSPQTQPSTAPAVTKSAEKQQTGEQDQDSIYKGLHPDVAKELGELRKFREAAEDKELMDVAKKYAIIGKKVEDLVPMFKGLKAAGGTAYDDMIAVLDQAVDVVEKSGTFSEFGKSGHSNNENSAEAKIASIAKKLVEENPALDYTQAMAKAWEDNPELLEEYDEQARM